MATPSDHALLSPSSAHRWLVCTASPRFEAQFEPGTSKYAEEGTLAHSICELYAKHQFLGLTTRRFKLELKKLQEPELYSPEMLTTAQAYVDYLTEKVNTFSVKPSIALEQRVDLNKWVPEGFGSCDCIMIGGDI